MSKSKHKHTPGPWRIDTNGHDEDSGGPMALTVIAPDQMAVADAIASIFDAHLIAAAPETL